MCNLSSSFFACCKTHNKSWTCIFQVFTYIYIVCTIYIPMNNSNNTREKNKGDKRNNWAELFSKLMPNGTSMNRIKLIINREHWSPWGGVSGRFLSWHQPIGWMYGLLESHLHILTNNNNVKCWVIKEMSEFTAKLAEAETIWEMIDGGEFKVLQSFPFTVRVGAKDAYSCWPWSLNCGFFWYLLKALHWIKQLHVCQRPHWWWQTQLCSSTELASRTVSLFLSRRLFDNVLSIENFIWL